VTTSLVLAPPSYELAVDAPVPEMISERWASGPGAYLRMISRGREEGELIKQEPPNIRTQK
jgi:hypothetical protein